MDLQEILQQYGVLAVVVIILWRKLEKNEAANAVREQHCKEENKALRAEITEVKIKDQETLRELGRTMKETNRLVRHIFKIVDDEKTPLHAFEPTEQDSDSRHKKVAEAPTEPILKAIR